MPAQDAAAQHGIHAAPSIRRHAQRIEQISGASEPSAPIGSIEPVTTTGRSICGRR